MNIETIRQGLVSYTGRFPAAAVCVTIEQREAMTPVLFAALQKVAKITSKAPIMNAMVSPFPW